jgi:hypothetical protein
MTEFKLKRKVKQEIMLDGGEVKEVLITTWFTIVVDLESGDAHFKGVNKTPFEMPQEILEILREEA